MIDVGPVRQWQEGDIVYTENDFIKLAWQYTDDPAKVRTNGWSSGPKQIWVEFIARPIVGGP